VTGWYVDRKKGYRFAWLHYDNSGRPIKNSLTPGLAEGTSLVAAYAQDRPRGNELNTKWEFEICAVCKSGKKKNTIYGCVTWGFDLDGRGVVTPHSPRFHNQPSVDGGFVGAVNAWNRQAAALTGNRNDPDQQTLDIFD
jgi:hypothetical protein